jgi:ethanolamine utilization protein EutQ (cupin superfamily)
MPQLIDKPATLVAHGEPPKQIEEFVGLVNSGHGQVSVARMHSPAGWSEPYQCPEFLEISIVIAGLLRVWHDGGVLDVAAGQAVLTSRGERVRYETPAAEGADYISVCLPAFSPATVHRG